MTTSCICPASHLWPQAFPLNSQRQSRVIHPRPVPSTCAPSPSSRACMRSSLFLAIEVIQRHRKELMAQAQAFLSERKVTIYHHPHCLAKPPADARHRPHATIKSTKRDRCRLILDSNSMNTTCQLPPGVCSSYALPASSESLMGPWLKESHAWLLAHVSRAYMNLKRLQRI